MVAKDSQRITVLWIISEGFANDNCFAGLLENITELYLIMDRIVAERDSARNPHKTGRITDMDTNGAK